jgi:hypothetical protein
VTVTLDLRMFVVFEAISLFAELTLMYIALCLFAALGDTASLVKEIARKLAIAIKL